MFEQIPHDPSKNMTIGWQELDVEGTTRLMSSKNLPVLMSDWEIYRDIAMIRLHALHEDYWMRRARANYKPQFSHARLQYLLAVMLYGKVRIDEILHRTEGRDDRFRVIFQ